jgi:hypothetical protein
MEKQLLIHKKKFKKTLYYIGRIYISRHDSKYHYQVVDISIISNAKLNYYGILKDQKGFFKTFRLREN